MLTTCTSAPPGSIRRATVAVRTVFCCVASRKRERTASGQPTVGTLQRKAQPSRAERHRSQPWGGGWSERPKGPQLSYWPTKKLLRPTVSVRAPFPTQPSRRDGRPPLPRAAGRNTPLHATRLRLPLAATGAARHSNRACRLQPAWSARCILRRKPSKSPCGAARGDFTRLCSYTTSEIPL